MKLIAITVSPTGETKVETSGYAGTDCINKKVSALESSLGVRIRVQLKPEFYETQTHHQQELKQ